MLSILTDKYALLTHASVQRRIRYLHGLAHSGRSGLEVLIKRRKRLRSPIQRMVYPLLFAAVLLLRGTFACQIMPICPAVLMQPDMISVNSEYLLKGAFRSLENDLTPFDVSNFVANLSLKSCKPQRRGIPYVCTAEISNFEVKWVCSAGQ